MTKTRTKLLQSLTGIGLSVVSTPSWAQQPSPSAGTSAEDQSTGIADIVVTAQRREERLQDVPISVTAVNMAQLNNSGIATTQDLTAVTPSLTVSQQTGAFLPRLRGVGSSFGGAGLDNSVATYIDGVYLAAAPAGLFSLAGVERIEVLKGPQGTLFGRNATGGLIQVVTRKPSETFSGSLSGSYGNYDTVGGDAYVTGGLAPGLAMDVAARASFQGDGFGRNRNLDIDANRTDRDLAFRSQLMFESGGTTARLAADFSELKGSMYEFRQSPFDVSTAGPVLTDQSPWDSNGNLKNGTHTKSYGLALNLTQDLSFADLVSITAARRSRLTGQIDADTTPTDAFSVDYIWKDKQFSQELQLVSKTGSRVSWLAGLYYFDGDARLNPTNVNFGPVFQAPSFPLATQRVFTLQNTRSYAAFGQTTVPLGETTRLTAGLRYTTERKRFSAQQFYILADGTQLPGGTRGPDNVNYKKFTWRLALDHKLTPDVMVYGSYNRGFKSGGFNPAGGIFDPPFNPEQLDAYEVGMKADLANRTVRFNPSFFYYNYKDLQVTAFSTLSLPIFINGPKATIYGLDLDFVVQPVKALTIRGGLTIIHDRLGDFPGAVFVYSNSPAPGGTQVIGNAKGNRVPYTPDWASTVAADYVVPMSFGKTTFSVTYNHSDGYYFEVDNLRKQRAYDIINGSIRVENEGGSLYASLWAKNILKEAVLIQVSTSAPLGGSAQFGAPRTYGITIGTKF